MPGRQPQSRSRKLSSETQGAKITVQELGQRFGDVWAVRNITLTFEPGSINVIIGGSGAGKTTLMRLLIGLNRPTHGSVVIDGKDMTQLNSRQLNKMRENFGMVFQYSALLDSLSVFENVAFPLREHRRQLKEKEIRELVNQKLTTLNLQDSAKKMPSELSGGMRKRTAFARAIMLEPRAIFYDEPTSGLDPISARLVDDLILEMREQLGVTTIVISHDMVGALNIADHLHLIVGGQLEHSGTPEEMTHSESPHVQAFLAASGIANKN